MEILVWIGKIVFGGYFVFSGLNHFMSMQNMKGYTASKGLPMPGLMTGLTGLMMIAGGLSVIFNMYLILGGWLLVSFLVLSAVLMHNFWKAEDANAKMMEMIQFQKNLALAAAMLLIMYW
jgi:uncharacterized membrane protein YphA (DoxX/SURF4 family)